MNTVELFAGIGGFRLAAESTSLRTVWANDICPRACAVYRSRFGSGQLSEGDILAHAADIPDHDLLTAGFPCQPRGSVRERNRRLIGPGILEAHRAARQAISDVGPGLGEPVPGREPGLFLMRIVPRAAADHSGNGRARGVRFHRVDTGMAAEE